MMASQAGLAIDESSLMQKLFRQEKCRAETRQSQFLGINEGIFIC